MRDFPQAEESFREDVTLSRRLNENRCSLKCSADQKLVMVGLFDSDVTPHVMRLNALEPTEWRAPHLLPKPKLFAAFSSSLGLSTELQKELDMEFNTPEFKKRKCSCSKNRTIARRNL